MLLKIPSKDTATVVAALGKHVRKLPQELRRSLTWDRGTLVAMVKLLWSAISSKQPLIIP
jgi:IS30 family transposase